MNEEMIAICGLICSSCPIFLATHEQEESEKLAMRASIASMCNEQYNMQISPRDVTDCDGCCVVNGRLFSGCLNCGIRKCASKKQIKSCAFCPDYACEQLNELIKQEPGAGEKLEILRKTSRH